MTSAAVILNSAADCFFCEVFFISLKVKIQECILEKYRRKILNYIQVMIKKRRKRKKYNRKRNIKTHKSLRKYILIIILLVCFVVVLSAAKNIFCYISESETDPSDPYPVRGVDVSEFQKNVNWKGLEDEGYSFAFIKATEGSSHIDSNFEYNWKEANKTDMKVGAYHFLSYDSKGITQAENYIDTVDKKWGMMPPVIDVEFYGKYVEAHPSGEKIYEVLDVILEALENEYRKKPIIYTNKYIYNTYISGRYDDYQIWISDPDIAETLDDGRTWLFCQYTFKGVSENIADGEKYVDLNVFNGSRGEFKKYSGR